MRRIAAITILLLAYASQASAQYLGKGYWDVYWDRDKVTGDSIVHFQLLPIHVFDRGIDRRRYLKMIRAVRKVYPLAKKAREEMAALEAELCSLPTVQAQKEFTKEVEKRLKKTYTPVLYDMTRYEGRILLKLIDRETEYTAYQIIKDFRSGFVAGFWQGIARVFGNNLKSEYDAEGDDRILEQIVVYYEAGLLGPCMAAPPVPETEEDGPQVIILFTAGGAIQFTSNSNMPTAASFRGTILKRRASAETVSSGCTILNWSRSTPKRSVVYGRYSCHSPCERYSIDHDTGTCTPPLSSYQYTATLSTSIGLASFTSTCCSRPVSGQLVQRGIVVSYELSGSCPSAMA